MLNRQPIPYQYNENVFLIRKIISNFDVNSIEEQPHRHGFHEFLYIKGGKGKHEIDGVSYHLKPHTFYVIAKGQVHNFLFAKDIKGSLIRFQESILPAAISINEGYYHNLLYGLSQHKEFPIAPSDQPLVELLLSRMELEYEGQSTKVLDLSLIQHLLYPILILLNRYISDDLNRQNYQQDQFAQFIKLLDTFYKQNHDLGFYAQELGISTRRLSEICRQKTGKTAKKVMNERILTEAKRLMKYTSLPLKEIADRLGFKDLGYFCRYFKKGVGETPSAFKES